MDFELKNGEYLIKKCFKKISFFLSDFFLDLDSILEGLGEGLGAFGQIFGFQFFGK